MSPFSHRLWPAWLAMVGSIVITLAVWHSTAVVIRESAMERFDFRVQQIRSMITERMADYQQVLRGGVALHYASENVSREGWRTYIEKLDLAVRYKGMQGFGIVKCIAPDQLETHISEIREQGFPDYTVYPPGPREAYTAIIYLEPFDAHNRRMFGYDMFSNPTCRAVMIRARDTGQPALCARSTLIQETDEDIQPDLLMYLPLYRKQAAIQTVQQRRDALVGYVFSPVRVHDLMLGILGEHPSDVSLSIYEGSEPAPGKLMFYSAGRYGHESPIGRMPFASKRVQIDLYGQTWTLDLASLPVFEADIDKQKPLIVLILGGVISVLLFGVTWLSMNTRGRALALADRMTIETRRSEALLEHKNKELEQFIHTASHDLKSPLVTILGYSGHIERGLAGRDFKELPEFLRRIISAAQRMQHLIDGLLDLSRVGRVSTDPKPTDVTALVCAIADELAPQLDEHSIQLVVQPGMPTIWADPQHFWQLFDNLLTNAIKYTRDQKSPIVEVGYEMHGQGPAFYVRDNGEGIDPKYHQMIFDMFQRLSNSSEGTGIGLAIVDRIAQNYGGRAWVESSPGQGATFWVTVASDCVVSPGALASAASL